MYIINTYPQYAKFEFLMFLSHAYVIIYKADIEKDRLVTTP